MAGSLPTPHPAFLAFSLEEYIISFAKLFSPTNEKITSNKKREQ